MGSPKKNQAHKSLINLWLIVYSKYINMMGLCKYAVCRKTMENEQNEFPKPGM